MTTGPVSNLPKTAPTDRKVAVLAVSPHDNDHSCLRAIFSHSNWCIYRTNNCREAMQFLQKNQIAVLVCEKDLPGGNWKELLDLPGRLSGSPLLVVASQDADDSLWAEALNLGAYDVLSKPFDRAEVTRIISLAWLHWKEDLKSASQGPIAGLVPEESAGGK